MRLEVQSYRVRDVRFGERTALRDGVLEIDAEALRRLLVDDAALEDVTVSLARPGESVRIIHVLDAIEPRVRVSQPGTDFPGFLSPPFTVGEGRTHRLAGVAVLEAAELPLSLGGLNVKEAIVDMSGPAAPFTPFAQTLNVVLTFRVRDGLSYAEYDAAIRTAGLRVAVHLAAVTRDLPADEVETFELGTSDALYVPRGVGNSFCTLTPHTTYNFLVNEHWSPERVTVDLFDPELAIAWPVEQLKYTERDAANPSPARR